MSDTPSIKDSPKSPVEPKAGLVRNADGVTVRLITDTEDITERKMMEEIFQTLSLNSPVGMYIVQDGEFVFVNHQLLSYFDTTEERWLRTQPMSGVRDEDRIMVRQNAIDMLKGRRTTPYEYAVTTRRGETKWFMETVAPIQYRGKRAILGNLLDITERKQTEERLQQTQRRFWELVNLLPLGVFEIDNELNIIFANQQAAMMLGYEEADINNISLYALDACAPEDRERMKASIETIMNGQPLGTAEFTLKRINGTRFPALIHATPIMRDGQVAGLRGVITDITERKQVEEIFQTVSMSSPASIYIIQDGTFVFANNRFLDRMGFAEEELLDINPRDVIHPEDMEMARRNTIEMLKGTRTTPHEYRAFSNTGEMMWVAETVASIHYKGRRAVLGSALNITEQKQAEEALKTQKNLTDHILATIPDAVLVIGEDNKVILANMAFYDSFGMKRSEVVDRPVSELIPEPGLS